MGYSARLSADVGGLTDQDIAQLADAGLAPSPPGAGGPIEGHVLRNGQLLSYTLDTSLEAPQGPRVVPEQLVIGALVMASFIAPLCHLLG